MSATFLLVCFAWLKESTCETRKNVFFFTLKALFILEIIKFSLFRYSNIMMSLNAQAWNTKHILNNLGSKHSLVMEFVILQNNFFYQKNEQKMWPGNKFQVLFNFQRILCKKDSVEVSMLIWTNSDSFAMTYLIWVACFKNFIF